MAGHMRLKWGLSGVMNSRVQFPFMGFSDRSAAVVSFDGEYSAITNLVATATATTLFSAQAGMEPELIVVVPEVAGNLVWASATDADSSGVEIRANWPFFISRGSVATYAATVTDAIDDTLADAQDLSVLKFYQSSGSTAKVHVFAAYGT